MYIVGFIVNGEFRPYRLFDFDPIIVGLLVSFAAVPIASLLSAPPPQDLVRKYFYRPKA